METDGFCFFVSQTVYLVDKYLNYGLFSFILKEISLKFLQLFILIYICGDKLLITISLLNLILQLGGVLCD